MLTALQKKTAQAIINIFETGQPRGDYGRVTLLAGDTGHLTYGKSQTTLASGNLYLLIKAYCEAPRAKYGNQLATYLARLKAMDLTLDHDPALRNLLQLAGDDKVMQKTQNEFFDRVYWTPGVQSAKALGILTPLGNAVVYDSLIHGSWQTIRDRVNTDHGPVSTIGEEQWVASYVQTRRNWLANHKNTLLHKTVYRMDSFKELIASAKWKLTLPLTVRGMLINKQVLTAAEPIRASAADSKQRILMLRSPIMQGPDVKRLQQALTKAGFPATVDGLFGKETDNQVRLFQKREGLKPDGIVGPARCRRGPQ